MTNRNQYEIAQVGWPEVDAAFKTQTQSAPIRMCGLLRLNMVFEKSLLLCGIQTILSSQNWRIILDLKKKLKMYVIILISQFDF